MSRGRCVVLGSTVLVVSVGAVAVFGLQAGGQERDLGPATPAVACEAAHPVAGGHAYLYVLGPASHVLTVFEDGAQVAAHQLPAKEEGRFHRYIMRTSRSEPVVGGHAYCFVVDMDLDMVHVFENAEYVASEELPETGEPVF